MVSGNLCYLLTNKTISKVPDSERYSNKEMIQNKNKQKQKHTISLKEKAKEKSKCSVNTKSQQFRKRNQVLRKDPALMSHY